MKCNIFISSYFKSIKLFFRLSKVMLSNHIVLLRSLSYASLTKNISAQKIDITSFCYEFVTDSNLFYRLIAAVNFRFRFYKLHHPNVYQISFENGILQVTFDFKSCKLKQTI